MLPRTPRGETFLYAPPGAERNCLLSTLPPRLERVFERARGQKKQLALRRRGAAQEILSLSSSDQRGSAEEKDSLTADYADLR